MAADCYCNPSVASSLCIHLLVYDEMRFYLTCKAMYRQSYARREWWAQVRDIDGLAFHTTPGVGQRSWNCYTTWHYCTANGTFLDPPEEAIVATPSPDESALTVLASDTSSTSGIPDSEMEIFMPYVYDQMLYLPLVDIAWDSPQLEGAAPRNGPLCEHCGLLTCVGRSEIQGLVCARCLQTECIDQWIFSCWSGFFFFYCFKSILRKLAPDSWTKRAEKHLEVEDTSNILSLSLIIIFPYVDEGPLKTPRRQYDI